MLDLKQIKKRLKAHRKGEYGPVPVDEGAQWLKDIDALVAEVERLREERRELDDYRTIVCNHEAE